MKSLMILECKGTCAPVDPLSKGSASVMHPRSGVPTLATCDTCLRRLVAVYNFVVIVDLVSYGKPVAFFCNSQRHVWLAKHCQELL